MVFKLALQFCGPCLFSTRWHGHITKSISGLSALDCLLMRDPGSKIKEKKYMFVAGTCFVLI